MSENVYTVSQLNGYIKTLIENDAPLSAVCVRGELSNYKIYPSGHHYFTMKDEGGSLKCVMFRGAASRLRFRPENGMSVTAFGRVSVYPRDGVYQLYVEAITADGLGDLHVAFEQLKDKLYKEGLFDPTHKKPLPRYPMRIAVVTSSAGAAVRDIIRVLRKRWPLAKVIILPVRVQGQEAPPEIAGALRYCNRCDLADLIITGRGGGSIEDLWCFNDERVARAIYDSHIPVISAVGHEPDYTIADFVADLRAATPSNGAELAVPDQAELAAALSGALERTATAVTAELRRYRERLDPLAAKPVMRDATQSIRQKQITLDHLTDRLTAAMERTVSRKQQRFTAAAASLDAMSPLKVLGRGYCIARTEAGRIVKTAKDVRPGDRLRLRLAKDTVNCTVTDVEE